MRTHARIGLPAAALMTLFFAAQGSRAAAQDLLVYESFDYGITSGNSGPIGGLDGGAGWASPWTGSSGDAGQLSFYPLDFSPWDAGPFQAHGTPMAGVGYSIESPPGMFWSNGSLSLDASKKQYVDLSAHIPRFQGLDRGTITVWVKTSSSGTQTVFAASAKTKSPISDIGVRLTNGRASVGVRGELLTNGTMNSSNQINDGLWHHIAVTASGDGNTRLYIDGVFDNESPMGFFDLVVGIDDMSIGSNIFNNGARQQFFDGLIDELAIWGSPLSDAEIAMLAGVNTLPLLVPGPNLAPGPSLEFDSLGSSAFPHAAFTSAGFTEYGNRFDDASGNRAGRLMSTELSTKTDATYYLSALIRREDNGATITPGEIVLADNKFVLARLGWDSSGNWITAIGRNLPPDTGNPIQSMNSGQTYFVVLRLDTLQTGLDTVFLKVFRTGDPIPDDDTMLSGQGSGANRWTVAIPGVSIGDEIDQIWLQQSTAGGSRLIVDEIRVGLTWAAVTSFTYGDGCAGARIGATNRPVLGASGYAIELTNVEPGTAAALLLGATPASLPFNGCTVLNSLDLVLGTAAGAGGSATFPIDLTAIVDPTFAGLSIYAQWAAANSTQGLVFSDGLQVLLEK